jgi:2-polyprenyl-6-methoxyphenol hydroxylase-like FAD-dependent oxidoreductase
MAGRHAVIVGGGITGLATALVLAGRGARVTVLERDREIDTPTPDEAFTTWRRKGAVQVRHSHAFLGRLRNLLRDRYPDLLAELVAAGARELRMLDVPPVTLRGLRPEPGDDDLVMLGCRRITFEWVLRRYVRERHAVTLISGATVAGLIADPGDPPRVTGVRYSLGEDAGAGAALGTEEAGAAGGADGAGAAGAVRELAADFVVDASGRHSVAARWLAAIGARAPDEEVEQSGIVYYTRFYRLRPGAAEPEPDVHPGAGDYNWIKFAIFPTDDRTFSITLASPLAFPEMRMLARAPAFDEVARSLPTVARWIDPARSEPIGDPERPVQAMGSLINRLRRFVDERGPLARSFFVLGDAAYCTNPLYGRGCAQGFLHAELLADALARNPGDPDAAALALDAAARREIEPFYRASLLADREAIRKAEHRQPRSWRARLQQRFFEEGVAVAMRCDPVVFRSFVRMMNMVETPEQAFGHPQVIWRSLRVWLRGKRRNRPYLVPPGPDRAEVLARCERALATAGARASGRPG